MWTFAQILAHVPILLDKLLPSSLRTIYLILLKITDLNPFAAFGLSCANHALRSFETRLLVAVIGPAVVSAVLVMITLVQVRVFGRDATQSFRRYSHIQLVLLFLVLPGTSTTIFRTFLCDVRETALSQDRA